MHSAYRDFITKQGICRHQTPPRPGDAPSESLLVDFHLRRFACPITGKHDVIQKAGMQCNVCNVSVKFKVTSPLQRHLTLRVIVCHTAGHYGEEYDD